MPTPTDRRRSSTPEPEDGTETDVFIVPEASVGDASALESAGGMSFTVTLSEASNRPVTFSYASADGSAVAGSDYGAVNGTLTIPVGASSGAIPVPITDDPV